MIARMALTSASTFAVALAQYNDSLAWEESALSVARDHRDAIRWLIANRARTTGSDGTTLNFDDLSKELAAVVEHINSRDLARRPRFVMGREGRPSSTRPWA